jgi:hypothetical protein
VSFRGPLRVALMLLPLATTATTIHAHRLAPDLATQEMNRCLKLVRIAATRRKGARASQDTETRSTARQTKRPPRRRTRPVRRTRRPARSR